MKTREAIRALIGAALVAELSITATPAVAEEAAEAKPTPQTCPDNRSPTSAMWLSILHPGLGEYYLMSWGPWNNLPPRKFWLGWIPGFGWPGYLQVVSAIDARSCRVDDWNSN